MVEPPHAESSGATTRKETRRPAPQRDAERSKRGLIRRIKAQTRDCHQPFIDGEARKNATQKPSQFSAEIANRARITNLENWLTFLVKGRTILTGIPPCRTPNPSRRARRPGRRCVMMECFSQAPSRLASWRSARVIAGTVPFQTGRPAAERSRRQRGDHSTGSRQVQGTEDEFAAIAAAIEHVFGLCKTRDRYLEPDERPGIVADYAVAAARNCLEVNDVSLDEVDLVICGGIARQYFEPATAMEVAAKLGLKRTHAFDVTAACVGHLEAIQTAAGVLGTARTTEPRSSVPPSCPARSSATTSRPCGICK